MFEQLSLAIPVSTIKHKHLPLMIKLFFSFSIVLATVLSLLPGYKPGAVATTKQITLCYTMPAADGMAAFATDPDFIALHLAPLPLQYEARGGNVTFSTPDGKDASGYLLRAKNKSDKWLFVYQEWWGLNDYIRRQSDTFYKDLGENVNVLALDMYDGQVTTDPAEAGKILQSVPGSRLESIINGGIAFAGKDAKIANVGWCYGGGLSLRSGLLGGKQTVGTVMYYGMPELDIEKLKSLNSDVLGHFATEQRISKEVVEEFAANMKKAGKKLDYKIYDAVHGFANPSNPKYDEVATKEAYGKTLDYLKKRLKV